ncbi:MAG: aromatic ring-hydroxylating dioxygenase subunit alpha [Burkholderiaceae bacterium]|nr:aromatic ring-hydroxylating dioxygenase subunit alpha [Burkholderiaceae bacterium]
MNYLRNAWYAAGWSGEIASRSALRRTLLDEAIALFRDESGAVHAIADRCPHRFAPLSLGKVVGEALQCPYHGLQFDGSGHCVHNPHGNGTIPKAARVPAHPVVERHGAVWIWMGDPARADPASIPDFGLFDEDRNYVGRGYLRVEANYRFGTDNIMDLSHIAYVHGQSLGSDDMRRSESSCEQDGRTIWSRRRNYGEKLPPAVLGHYRSKPDALWDRSFDVRWDPPASLLLLVGGVPSGQSLEDKRPLPFAHLFTPETATTSHYWFAASYPKELGPKYEARAQEALAFLAGPFEREDLPMLQAQQRAVGDRDFWDLKPVMLAGDAAAVRARRLLDKLIEDEREALHTQPSFAVG